MGTLLPLLSNHKTVRIPSVLAAIVAASCRPHWFYVGLTVTFASQVDQCVGGFARFRFEELCNRTLGAADYIAVAQAFHTVFITDIPTMSLKVQKHLQAEVAAMIADT